MLVNENIFRDNLREAIANVTNRELRPVTIAEKQIKELAVKMFNITGGEIAYILNGRTPVDNMSDDTMFKVASILREYITNYPGNFDLQKLDVEKFFNENEIRNYSKKIDRRVIDKDIVFDYFVPISDDQMLIGISNKMLVELSSNNKIHYNPETQRNLTSIETEYGNVKKVTINEDAFDEIFETMRSNTYIPDLLTFNINPDSYAQPRIVNNKLIITKESIIDCIDGFHRLKAAIAVTKLTPEWNVTFPVMLTGFDVKKAKRYIIQENYKTHLTDEQVTEDDQDDAANFIINKLSSSEYLRDSNINNIKYQLNRIINQIFKPEKLKSNEQRQKALDIFRIIEKDINSLIENNNWIGKEFTKEEWFVYLYLINLCNLKNKDFYKVVSKININIILDEISITNEPTKKHFKIMGEVSKNV